jgi:hypothetical protein
MSYGEIRANTDHVTGKVWNIFVWSSKCLKYQIIVSILCLNRHDEQNCELMMFNGIWLGQMCRNLIKSHFLRKILLVSHSLLIVIFYLLTNPIFVAHLRKYWYTYSCTVNMYWIIEECLDPMFHVQALKNFLKCIKPVFK